MLGQQQPGHVCTRNQQHEANCAQQCVKRRPDIANNFIHKLVDDDSLTPILCVLLFESRSDPGHLRRRLLGRDSGFESRQNAEHVCPAHCGPLCGKRHRRPELLLLLVESYVSGGGGPSRIDSCGHHADDCVGIAIERDAPVDNVSVTGIPALPEVVAEQNDLALAAFILLRQKRAAEYRIDTNDSKVS
jgi:hypothetical protein